MKRSEMIEILDKYLNEVCYQDYVPHAGGIVEILEQAGMAPPEVTEPCPTYFIDATGNQMQGEDSTVFIRKWDEE